MKISEIFRSFQGEGKYTGYPAIFVRFFGCNLSCNFGGETEPQNISDLKDFKVPERGCDSGYAWQKEYEHLAKDYSPREIALAVLDLIPKGINTNEFVLVFTGGEPLLFQKEIVKILRFLESFTFHSIIFETNGTVKLNNSLRYYIDDMTNKKKFHFSISPKLTSLTNQKISIGALENLIEFNSINTVSDFILKYVLDNTESAWEELDAINENLGNVFSRYYIDSKTYVMPLGGTKEQQMDIESIVLRAIEKGYKISLRTHCYVFANKIGS